MTLRLRLTLLYTSLLGGTLLLFGALVYTLVSLALVSQTDNYLMQQADTITKSLRVNSVGQFDIQYLDELDTQQNTVFFQVWGIDRKLQYSRPRTWQEPLDPAGRHSGLSMFKTTFTMGNRLRVYSLPLITERGPSGMLQVAVSLSLLDTTQSALASVLILLAILSMILAAMIASFAINRALAPLSTMTTIAETITRADDLSRRIPIEGNRGDEIGTLVRVFNETLARLENLFATQRRFVADVSHELRTPLTVIKGEVSLMRKLGGMDEESLSGIESEVDRLTRLVGNLLLLAQAESGKLPMDLKKVELDTVLLDVFQQVRTLAGDRINVQIDEIEQVVVTADRDRIKQVLLNIAGNAVQYTPLNGKVTLSLKVAGDQARIVIADTGPGIPAEDLPHIFERFYRGEKSRTRSINTGFGLGLSIALWIVRSHGGGIDVASREGVGTSFIIRLPIHVVELKDVPL
jgi:two-component system, OmpR family, sensor kinase